MKKKAYIINLKVNNSKNNFYNTVNNIEIGDLDSLNSYLYTNINNT